MRDNVEVVFDGVQGFNQTGILDSQNKARRHDVVVFATGFYSNPFLKEISVVNEKVTKVARDLGIDRRNLYQWIKIYKEKNNTIKSEFPNFIPFYEESYDDFEHNLPLDLFNKLKTEDKEWLITSRLDNDDMLANDTIDVIQKGFENKDMLLLEIPYGLTMQVAEYNCLRKFKSKLNPFISLIECITNKPTTKSVFYHQHNQWTSVETKNVSKKTQWIQVIHEKNVFNRANGYLTYTFGKLNRFTFLDKDIKFESLITVANKKTKRTLRLIKKKILNE